MASERYERPQFVHGHKKLQKEDLHPVQMQAGTTPPMATVVSRNYLCMRCQKTFRSGQGKPRGGRVSGLGTCDSCIKAKAEAA